MIEIVGLFTSVLLGVEGSIPDDKGSTGLPGSIRGFSHGCCFAKHVLLTTEFLSRLTLY